VVKTARSEQHTQHHIGAWFSHAARLGVAAVAMGVSLCAVAAGAAAAQSVKNIVLVHGADRRQAGLHDLTHRCGGEALRVGSAGE